MEMLKQSMNDAKRTITSDDSDVLQLLAEIAPTHDEIAGEEIADPHPHDIEVGVPMSNLHSIPLTQSPSESNFENKTEENQ